MYRPYLCVSVFQLYLRRNVYVCVLEDKMKMSAFNILSNINKHNKYINKNNINNIIIVNNMNINNNINRNNVNLIKRNNNVFITYINGNVSNNILNNNNYIDHKTHSSHNQAATQTHT